LALEQTEHMNIVTISGSAHKESSNERLLKGIALLVPEHSYTHISNLMEFPLFNPSINENPPEIIIDFKQQLTQADLVIIATPEYVHNIPAALKNAFEWITSSGELHTKKVIAITYTPATPRGEKAMQSMLWSLAALNATILCELPLYKTDITTNLVGELYGDEYIEAIKTAIGLAGI
jgi:chromate reductase, NAD(P)H dehydrogenase (quinone)